jgi:membrane fusion protein (multidrug efflux system)
MNIHLKYRDMKQYKCLLYLAISILAVACRQAPAKQKENAGGNAKEYTFSEVMQRPLASSIQLPAVLEPFEKVSIYPRVNGFVKRILVDRGTVVRKGQLLLELEAPEIDQQYYAAQSKYLQASALYAASKDNYERTLAVSATPGTISAHDLELARARMMADSALMNSEHATFRALEATKGYLNVKAPFDGVITERNIHPGALVGPNANNIEAKPMLMLEEEDRLRLVLQVPEMYSAQLSPRRQVSFQVNAMPGKTFTGIISRQAGTLSNRFRSEAVEIDVPNGDHMLKPGMYAEAILPVDGAAQALVVPSSAVVTSTEKRYVITVRDKRTKWVAVQEGNRHNDSTEVFGSLHPHDRVILNATDEIRENIAVE